MTCQRSHVKSGGNNHAPGGPQAALDRAFEHCDLLAAEHYENFPVGGRWIPKSKRKYVHAIYAFARIADDFADEARHDGTRLELLHDWREQLAACYRGEADHPVFIALRETVQCFEIPQGLLSDLLTAFEQDVVKSRYANFEEVLAYCKNSANPVGRLVLLLFNYRQEELHRLSDFICTGLQLANFWQDVAIDLEKDRIYLPADDQQRYGVDEKTLQSGCMTDPLREMMAFQVERTREIFEQGRSLPTRVGKDLAFELKLVWLGGMRILEKLEKAGYDFYQHRPVISLGDKLLLLWRATRWRADG